MGTFLLSVLCLALAKYIISLHRYYIRRCLKIAIICLVSNSNLNVITSLGLHRFIRPTSTCLLKKKKENEPIFQLSPTPHSTDISLTNSGPCFSCFFFFFLLFSTPSLLLHPDQDYKKDLKSVCTCYSFIGSRLLHCKFPGLSRVM